MILNIVFMAPLYYMSLKVARTLRRVLLRRFCPKQGGRTRNEDDGYEKDLVEISLRSFGRHIARRLHSLPVVDRR